VSGRLRVLGVRSTYIDAALCAAALAQSKRHRRFAVRRSRRGWQVLEVRRV
jgi:hypothetical protein